MRYRLLDLVACPRCGGDLRCARVDLEDAEFGGVREGELGCAAGHRYPVIDGVPRLLPPELLGETLAHFHPEWYRRYRDSLAGEGTGEPALKKKTLRSFGFQWNAFSEMYAQWEANFRSYFEPLVRPEGFRGRLVLDAGCGFGRHAYYAAGYGAEVVAMDLSEAVAAAHRNTRALGGVHVVQGDIYRPPLKPVFEMIYCVGVIQHLPDPEQGFRSLARLLAVDGALFVWVYGRRRGVYRLVDLMRRATTRMSMGPLYRLAWGLNLLSFAAFSLPYRVLRRIPGGGPLARAWPFTRYADLPLRVGHADWFDRLSAPSTVYFERAEVEAWYRGAGLTAVEIQSREGIGWRALGRVKDRAAENAAGTETD